MNLQAPIAGRTEVHEHEAATAVAKLVATIERFAPPDSVYAREATRIVKGAIVPHVGEVQPLFGLLEALREAYQRDALLTMRELVHREMFGDLLDVARYFLEEGHKDPAAVIAGGVLEAHLRALAARFSVEVIAPDPKKGTAPKKAETLNADLKKAGAYELTDQKAVTSWLDLRNLAAHGEYAKYGEEQVRLLVEWVRDFIRRCPA